MHTRFLIGVICHILNEFRTDILEFVFQLDGFGDRHTVFGDFRRTPALFEDYIAALRTGQEHERGR